MSVRQKLIECCLTTIVVLALAATGAAAGKFSESPALADLVKAGGLPPVAQRLPEIPRVVEVDSNRRHAGDMRISMAKAKDNRMMTVYG